MRFLVSRVRRVGTMYSKASSHVMIIYVGAPRYRCKFRLVVVGLIRSVSALPCPHALHHLRWCSTVSIQTSITRIGHGIANCFVGSDLDHRQSMPTRFIELSISDCVRNLRRQIRCDSLYHGFTELAQCNPKRLSKKWSST